MPQENAVASQGRIGCLKALSHRSHSTSRADRYRRHAFRLGHTRLGPCELGGGVGKQGDNKQNTSAAVSEPQPRSRLQRFADLLHDHPLPRVATGIAAVMTAIVVIYGLVVGSLALYHRTVGAAEAQARTLASLRLGTTLTRYQELLGASPDYDIEREVYFASKSPSQMTEYLWVHESYYVQALTEQGKEQVVLHSVTIRDPSVRYLCSWPGAPSPTPVLGDATFADAIDPADGAAGMFTVKGDVFVGVSFPQTSVTGLHHFALSFNDHGYVPEDVQIATADFVSVMVEVETVFNFSHLELLRGSETFLQMKPNTCTTATRLPASVDPPDFVFGPGLRSVGE